MTRSAVIVGDYRYSLRREWATGPFALFCMLNPSTADAETDDPTIRRCVSFCTSMGCGSLRVVNLFGWRATNPKILSSVPDPVGPENDAYVVSEAKGASFVVAAWGANAPLNRAVQVLAMLRQSGLVYCLGMTAKGFPRHPLYLPSDTPLVPLRWP